MMDGSNRTAIIREVIRVTVLFFSAPPCRFLAVSTVMCWSHAGGSQSHAGGVAHAGQRLNGLGEVVGEDSSVFSAVPVAAHPGQGGAVHGVVDGLLVRRKKRVSLHTWYQTCMYYGLISRSLLQPLELAAQKIIYFIKRKDIESLQDVYYINICT